VRAAGRRAEIVRLDGGLLLMAAVGNQAAIGT